MKIFFDGTIFSLQKAGGVSVYAANLLTQFSGFLKKGDELILGLRDGYEDNVIYKKQKRFLRSFKKAKMGFWDYGWPLFDFKTDLKGVEIVHSPYFSLPKKKKNRTNILTIHDLINHRRQSRGFRQKANKILSDTSVQRADHFICVSENTKKELLEMYQDIPEEKISVIYHGVSEIFTESYGEKTANLAGLPDKYLLFVGKREGYKNFKYVLNILAEDRDSDLKLVCVGGPFTREETQKIKDLNLNKKIVHVFYSDAIRLAALYKKAFALVYPSLEEGFGMPVLEAMACGCPVIASGISVLREVGGEAALYLRSYDYGEFADRLRQCSDVSIREEIVKAGLERAKEFSWQKAAKQTWELYKRYAER